MRVGLVIVSHSARLAEGVAEVASQMAPDVTIAVAGGMDDGLGTDFDAVAGAIDSAQDGAGVVVLYDLGSAKMVAELAVEMLGDPESAAVVDAPLVEGAVAAAAAAQGGADLDAVLSAAAGALAAMAADAGEVEGGIDVLLTNDVGLHARPAGLLARTLSDVDAAVTVSFGGRSADARSVLSLMGLGAGGGDRVRVSATGPQAEEALRRVEELAARGFDEASPG
ncbi:Phosphoenolpyruvate-dihydroxyacetone phosphotransferase, subunit DhaM; DHA-specific IIA component / DHA-specific phosphocarrier protein HPr [Alloactinosynnema sp. L-07]|uniref:dihydroxyacetone kinase phosphoryl donor subunit DhaM n=1 Tax=Alloactinosynnema sp. L-07 TaxID=1653480 RepID=UPI00065F0A10|nr:dihydroxyacetone kinase phosphoryl donor subunit DhaM [Alloactinosynnema sp. L-07]CRK59001.1 Phosphoenolpyruvate-dihydroxyacetone phosphotransferase, subunit DhaM; DHA-specific IIA component / DHA-specific phosphocarrier protein HPr [Alloactinosynnema sp. L-07]